MLINVSYDILEAKHADDLARAKQARLVRLVSKAAQKAKPRPVWLYNFQYLWNVLWGILM